MIFETLSNTDIRNLIDEYTRSEKLKLQLYDRIIDGKTYAEMGLVGGDYPRRLQEKEYVTFRQKYDGFRKFVEKKVAEHGIHHTHQ